MVIKRSANPTGTAHGTEATQIWGKSLLGQSPGIPPFPNSPNSCLPKPQTHPLEKKKKFISRVMMGARRPPSFRTWGRGRKHSASARGANPKTLKAFFPPHSPSG